jgi:hypothetical protein
MPATRALVLELDPEFETQSTEEEVAHGLLDLSSVIEDASGVEQQDSPSFSLPNGFRKLLNLGRSASTDSPLRAARSPSRIAAGLSSSQPLPGVAIIPIKPASSFVPGPRNVGGWEKDATSTSPRASTSALPYSPGPARSHQPAMSQRASAMMSLSELSKAALASSSTRTTRSRSVRQESLPFNDQSLPQPLKNFNGGGGGNLFTEDSQMPSQQSQPQSLRRNQWAAAESDSESGSDGDGEANGNVRNAKNVKKGVVWK